MDKRNSESGDDERAAEDYKVELLVELEDGTGITSSVSANRVVFKSDRSFEVGAPIRFRLSIKSPGEDLVYRLYAEGTVMCVEPCGKQWSVAVKITSFRFESHRLGE